MITREDADIARPENNGHSRRGENAGPGKCQTELG